MDYISGWCKSTRRLNGCTAIVTGSNTGLGKETALEFYRRGAKVIMGCRDLTKASKAKAEMEQNSVNSKEPKGELIIEKLDLSKLSSVREFAFRVLSNEEQINILVNNAGVMMCPKGLTEDGFETHMGTNHFGHALLTLLLLPRLRKSAPARIVCVSSYLHQNHEIVLDDINLEKTRYDPIKAYCLSKAANVLFSRGLAQKLEEHKIEDVTAYSLHPGVICTDIARHIGDTIYTGATWVFNNILSWFLKSPRCGAQTTIYCALDEDCAHETGLYYSDCTATPPSKQCQDEDFVAKFWDVTINYLRPHINDFDPFGNVDPNAQFQ